MQQRATLAKAQGRLRRIGAWCDRNSRHNLTYRLDNAFAAYTIIVYASLSLYLSLSLSLLYVYIHTLCTTIGGQKGEQGGTGDRPGEPGGKGGQKGEPGGINARF